MPRLTRWFKVNDDINSDPEVWEMRNTIGERSLGIWLEFIAMGNRNLGKLPPMSDSTASSIAFKCHSSAIKVRQVWDFSRTKAWIVSDPTPRLRNYPYPNDSRENNKSQAGTHKKREERKDNIKNADSASPQPSAGSQPVKPKEPKEPLKLVADRLRLSHPEASKRITAFVETTAKEGYSGLVIAKGLERLEDAMGKGKVNGDWWPYAKSCVKKSDEMARDRDWKSKKAEEKRSIANLEREKRRDDGKRVISNLIESIGQRIGPMSVGTSETEARKTGRG